MANARTATVFSSEERDLTYKGIVTLAEAALYRRRKSQEERDLTYKGIVTRHQASYTFPRSCEERDLTYKGIVTIVNCLPVLLLRGDRRKRPDIQRDCDASLSRMFTVTTASRRKRPDIQRDCDLKSSFYLYSKYPPEERDLTYKGIVTHFLKISKIPLPFPEERDLTYKGIVTFISRR